MQQLITDTEGTKASKFYICQGYNTKTWVSWLLGSKEKRSLKLIKLNFWHLLFPPVIYSEHDLIVFFSSITHQSKETKYDYH